MMNVFKNCGVIEIMFLNMLILMATFLQILQLGGCKEVVPSIVNLLSVATCQIGSPFLEISILTTSFPMWVAT